MWVISPGDGVVEDLLPSEAFIKFQLIGKEMHDGVAIQVRRPNGSLIPCECRFVDTQGKNVHGHAKAVCTWDTIVRIGKSATAVAKEREIPHDFVAFNEDVLKRMTCLVEASIRRTSNWEETGLETPYCVLLEGPPGVGKTCLIRHVAHTLSVNVVSFQEEWTRLSIQQNEHEFIPPTYDQAFSNCLKKAENCFPALIHIEQAQFLLGPQNLSTDFSCSGRDELFFLTLRKYLQDREELLSRKGSESQGSLIILESQSTKMIDSNVLTKIPDHVYFPQPDMKERMNLTRHLAKKYLVESNLGSIDLELINGEMMGFNAAEVNLVFQTANLEMKCRELLSFQGRDIPKESEIHLEDFMKAIREVRPRSSGRVEEVPLHNVKLEDVGGLENAKEALYEMLILPKVRPDLFSGGMIKPARALLLFGPPGTGKTLLAKSMSAQAGLAFIAADVAQLVKSGIGESERQLVEIFQRASEAAPCMLFLDELQAAFARPESEENDGTGSRQLASQLKLEMDALQSKPEVYVMGATNAVHMLDPDLLRPGRFDHVIQVKLPDLDARKTILSGILRSLHVKFDQDAQEQQPEDKQTLAELLAVRTAGCSGADLRHLCQLAGLRAISQDRNYPTPQDFVTSLTQVTNQPHSSFGL